MKTRRKDIIASAGENYILTVLHDSIMPVLIC